MYGSVEHAEHVSSHDVRMLGFGPNASVHVRDVMTLDRSPDETELL